MRHLFGRSVILAALLPLSLSAIAQTPSVSANGWGVPATDVPADPAIRLGNLPNGMKYAIMRNGTPKGAASVRLRIGAGSLAEAENERGLAHFIEHMAFNGTTNVAEGEMVRILERQGLRFGPDTNALTGFDSTSYMLELPVADQARVDNALFLMREVASEVKFDPAAVDRERGVILGERRSREGFQLRQLIDQLGFTMPQALHARRLPIGTPQVLQTASAETMRALYRRYYRPENATLVVVGDIDPQAIEAKIKAKFADWRGVGPAGAKPAVGKIDFARPTAVDTFRNTNVATAVSVTVLRPYEEPIDTRAERRDSLLDSLGTAILSRRLTRLVNREDSPLIGASAGSGGFRDLAFSESLTVSAKDGAWADALAAAERELRSALANGFTAAELKRELARMETGFRTTAEQAGTRSNATLAATIAEASDDRAVLTNPAWRLAFFKEIQPTITLDAVNAAFREKWKGSAPLIHVSEKLPVTPAAIGMAWAEAQMRPLPAAVAAAADQAFAYEDFGQPGKVVSDTRIADLGIRTVRFANNVRLNIKKTDFEAGRVRFSVRMAGGQAALPQDKPGLNIMLSSLSTMAGTGRQSFEDIKEALAGRVYSAGSSVGPDAFSSGGATTPADLALQMKVSAAYLTDPGYRPEAAQRWSNIVPVIDKQFDSQPMSVFATRVPVILLNNDYRFGAPPAQALLQRNFAEARAAMTPLLADAPIEIGIVGDMDEDAAIAAVAASFGALPKRRDDGAIVDPRKVTLRADRSPIRLTHSGPADQALVAAFWPTDDDDDFRKEIGMGMLAQALDLMLTESIREQLGASYGVSVGSTMSDVYDDFGTLSASTVVAPDKIDEVEAAFDAATQSLRDKPIDQDLFNRVRAPILESLARSRRENGWWLGVAARAQGRAARLERVRQQEAIYAAMTPAELQRLAKQYLLPETLRRVRVVSVRTPNAGLITTAAR
ncbi:insulinase family protein [Sphingomonas sp. LY29]|uniref:M16 family metallopeptidase n=1 Tax=Sphingomonas sp. LY29 TaxID=3095341 RepID=UPI002D77714B|nr:insulinase family protein [Sphingomonas sp. LY29]WRP25545.1 insulinase family protein [Sphingomonas sp. LY29]WRP25555.1 insulinase family protein [Sphingomonas sp. LY29]